MNDGRLEALVSIEPLLIVPVVFFVTVAAVATRPFTKVGVSENCTMYSTPIGLDATTEEKVNGVGPDTDWFGVGESNVDRFNGVATPDALARGERK